MDQPPTAELAVETSVGRPTVSGPSGNATLALVLGILALVCGFGPFTGIPAWILGRMEIRSVDQGRSAPTGRAPAAVGMYLGIAGTVISVGLTLVALVLTGMAWTHAGKG